MKLKTIILFMLFAFLCTTVGANDKNVTHSTVSSGDVVTWYDGDTQRKAYILKDYIVELGSSPSTVKSIDKNAETRLTRGNIKLHKISDANLKENLAKGVVPANVKKQGAFLPALSTTGDESGLIVPSGNIIVKLNTKEESEAKAWAAKHNLKYVKKLFGSLFVVESVAGLEAIQLANELRNKEGVLSATPDFYTNAVPK
ncbi:MAG: hypothetical protein QXO70_05195 [Candidatus Pacearchaeota archaeon]